MAGVQEAERGNGVERGDDHGVERGDGQEVEAEGDDPDLLALARIRK